MSSLHRSGHHAVPFSVTPAFFCLVILYVFAGNLSLLPHLLAAVLVHECGHLIAIWISGGKAEKIEATLLGFVIRINAGLSSYLSEALISLAGPAASITAAVAASLAAKSGVVAEQLYLFSGISVILGIMNLLPASQLDGGRALYRLLCLLISPETAFFVSRFLSVCVAVLTILAGAYILYVTKYNLTLLLIGIWLLIRSEPDY